MRRTFDFLSSLLLLILISPIFIVLMLLVKLTSRGPIFFKQRRIGKNNKEFILYKFRTMRIDTPNVATHLLKDPKKYITPVGKFLRKSSCDELPQLINIMKGDMTYIGPRPALYNQYDLTEMRTRVGVHRLLPGVTGWAQINGRDAISLSDKVMHDRFYLMNRSIIFNLRILCLTFLRVLKADGVVEGGVKKVEEKEFEKIASL